MYTNQTLYDGAILGIGIKKEFKEISLRPEEEMSVDILSYLHCDSRIISEKYFQKAKNKKFG